MATKKNNFEEIFGIYRNDHIADFANLDNETKLRLYSELYKWTQKCLSKRSGKTSIYGRVSIFTENFESVTNSGETTQERFKRIANAAGLNWDEDYYPDIENINLEREGFLDALKKGYIKPASITADNVDEKFARLLAFSGSVKVVFDRLGVINNVVVEKPMEANNKLEGLKTLVGADSEEVKKIEKLIEKHQYDSAIKEADSVTKKARKEAKKQVKPVNAESVEMTENTAIVPNGTAAAVPYSPNLRVKSAIGMYNRLVAIAREVRGGIEQRGTKYKKIASNIYDFVRYNHTKYSAIINAYNKGIQEDGSNTFLEAVESGKADIVAVVEFINQMTYAYQSLLHHGINVNELVDKYGKVNMAEVSKLIEKTAGDGRATKEELLSESVKILDRARVILDDIDEHFESEINVEVIVKRYSSHLGYDEKLGIYKGDKVKNLTDTQVKKFHEDMMKVSDVITAVSESSEEESKKAEPEVKPVPEKVTPSPVVPTPSPTPAPVPKKEDKKRADETGEKKSEEREKSKKAPEKTESKPKKGALVIEPKKPTPDAPTRRLVDPKKVYNAPGMENAVKIRGFLSDITFLLRQGMKNGTKYPKRLEEFYDKYFGMLLKNDSFYQEYVDNMKYGEYGIEMTLERVADIRLRMQGFIADMQEVEEEFKSRKLDISKLIEFERQKNGDVYPVWNKKELKKFINAYRNALDDAEIIVVPNPTYPDTTGLVRHIPDPDSVPSPKREGLVPTRPTPVVTPSADTSSGAVVVPERPSRTSTPITPVVPTVTEPAETPVEPSITPVEPARRTSEGAPVEPVRTSDGDSHVPPTPPATSSDSASTDTGYDFEPIRRTRAGEDTRRRPKRGERIVSDIAESEDVDDVEAVDSADDISEDVTLPKEGFFKRLGKWIARRPVWAATIVLGTVMVGGLVVMAVPALSVVAAPFVKILPDIATLGLVGVIAGNGVKAVAKGIFPRYKRFIHKYDIDKTRRKLEVVRAKKRQSVKDVERILADKRVTREDIREYVEVEKVKKPKRKTSVISDMKDFVKGKRLTADEKALRKAEYEDYKAKKRAYKSEVKAGKQASRLNKSKNSNLTVKGMDVTGLDATQMRAVELHGAELTKLDRLEEKYLKRIGKKNKRVLKVDERISAEQFNEDAEMERAIRNSSGLNASQRKTAADAKEISKGVINTGVGRYIDSKLRGFDRRTEKVEKQAEKAESKALKMIEKHIDSGNVQYALDYVVKDMIANDGVINDAFEEYIREKVGAVGLQYIRAKYMETDAKLKDATASETVLREIKGGSSKEKSNTEMAVLRGKYYYRKGMILSEVQEKTKTLPPEIRIAIIQAYKDIKKAEDRFM